MATKTQVRIVLEYPNRGGYAPNKFGCHGGNFLKTRVEGLSKEIWVLDGKVFNLPEDADEWNKRTADVMQHAYGHSMNVLPRVLPPNVATNVATNAKPKRGKAKPKPDQPKTKADSETPRAPALIGPPPTL